MSTDIQQVKDAAVAAAVAAVAEARAAVEAAKQGQAEAQKISRAQSERQVYITGKRKEEAYPASQGAAHAVATVARLDTEMAQLEADQAANRTALKAAAVELERRQAALNLAEVAELEIRHQVTTLSALEHWQVHDTYLQQAEAHRRQYHEFRDAAHGYAEQLHKRHVPIHEFALPLGDNDIKRAAVDRAADELRARLLKL